jgi:hypothetical protein
VDSLAGIQALVPRFQRDMQSITTETFKKTYLFTHAWLKAEGSKNLGLQEACAYWNLLLAPVWSTHLESWIEFITVSFLLSDPMQLEHNRPISRDTWSILLDFITQSTHADFDDYDCMIGEG